jgi:hypothetical protein
MWAWSVSGPKHVAMYLQSNSNIDKHCVGDKCCETQVDGCDERWLALKYYFSCLLYCIFCHEFSHIQSTSVFFTHCKHVVTFNLCDFRKMSSLCDKATETGMLMKILSATVAFGNTQKSYCSNSKDLLTSVDNYITVLLIRVPNLWHLNAPKVCC